jgi:hypothetical protein
MERNKEACTINSKAPFMALDFPNLILSLPYLTLPCTSPQIGAVAII